MFILGLGLAAVGIFGLVSAAGDRYECSPEEVQDAVDSLKEINGDIEEIHEDVQNQINIINNNIQGFEDYLNSVNANGEVVQDSVTSLIAILTEQADLIEEYNNASYLKKLGSTYAMVGTNLFEGAVSVLEDIGDAAILVGATVFSPFTDTKSWQVFAARDLTGEAFDYLYDDGFLKGIETYSGFSHESTAANVFKGIGSAIPYVALAASGIGLAGEAIAAGTAGLGRGSSDYMSQHLMYGTDGELTFDDDYSLGRAWWEGGKEGVKDAALTIVMDKGIKKLGELKNAKVQAETITTSANEQLLSKYGKNIDETTDVVKTMQDDIFKGLKEKAGSEMSEEAIQTEAKRLAEKAGKGKLTSEEFKKVNELIPEGKKVAQEEVEAALNKKLVANEEKRLANNPSKAERREIRQAGEEALQKQKNLITETQEAAIKKDAELGKIQEMATKKNLGSATTKELKAAGKEAKAEIKGTISGKTTSVAAESELQGKLAKNWGPDDFEKAAGELGENNAAVKEYRAAKALDDQAKSGNRLINPGQKVDVAAMNKMGEANTNLQLEYIDAKGPTTAGKKALRIDAHDARIEKLKDSGLGKATAKANEGISKLKTTVQTSKPVQEINQAAQKIVNSKPAQKIAETAKSVASSKPVQTIGKVVDDAAGAANKVITNHPKLATGIAATTMAASKMDNSRPYVSPYVNTNMTGIDGGEYTPDGSLIGIDEVDDLVVKTATDTPTTPEPTAPVQTYTGGTSTAGENYTAPTISPTTPSSNDNTTTTPSEKPNDGNTTTPGTNDNNNNNNNKSDDSNKTPDKTTPATPEPTPTPSDNGSTVISNPPSNNNQGSSGTNHGGTTNNNTGNSSTGNNNWSSNTTTEPGIEENPELEPELPIEDADLIDEPGEEESVYTIPSNLSGVKQTKKSSPGSGVLPVLGGLGAAAAVGVGAKMYLDNKKNNENGDDDEEYLKDDDENFNTSENDDLLADEWNGEDTELNYEDPSGDNSVGTDDDDLGEM